MLHSLLAEVVSLAQGPSNQLPPPELLTPRRPGEVGYIGSTCTKPFVLRSAQTLIWFGRSFLKETLAVLSRWPHTYYPGHRATFAIAITQLQCNQKTHTYKPIFRGSFCGHGLSSRYACPGLRQRYTVIHNACTRTYFIAKTFIHSHRCVHLFRSNTFLHAKVGTRNPNLVSQPEVFVCRESWHETRLYMGHGPVDFIALQKASYIPMFSFQSQLLAEFKEVSHSLLK